MDMKSIIKSQYWASLQMLKEAIEKCPDDLWFDESQPNMAWHLAYHTLFFAHFYLHPSEKDYVPWEHREENCIGLSRDKFDQAQRGPYAKAELLAYFDLVMETLETQINAVSLEAESGFNWLPMNKLELQFYNIRHIMQHTGELFAMLNTRSIELRWVGMQKDK